MYLKIYRNSIKKDPFIFNIVKINTNININYLKYKDSLVILLLAILFSLL